MRERDGGSVTLSNLSPQAVRSFLDFAYSGRMEITEENVDMLFQLASFLQVALYKVLSVVRNYPIPLQTQSFQEIQKRHMIFSP